MQRIIFISVFIFNQAFAQVAVDDKQNERIFTLNELTYFIDQQDTLTITEASSPAFIHNFWTHSLYQNIDFKSGAAYWIRMPK